MIDLALALVIVGRLVRLGTILQLLKFQAFCRRRIAVPRGSPAGLIVANGCKLATMGPRPEKEGHEKTDNIGTLEGS
jgi:hypothetical protein